jgi:Domain of unknown function (DUF4878)
VTTPADPAPQSSATPQSSPTPQPPTSPAPPPILPPPILMPPALPQPLRPSRRRTLKIVLITVGVVFVLCCGGAITGGVLLFRSAAGSIRAVRTETSNFVTDLEISNYADAYARLCAGTRANFTEDRFREGVQAQPHIRSHRITTVNVSNVNGHVTGLATVQFTQDSGFVDQHVFTLVKEDGAWKVCGQPY